MDDEATCLINFDIEPAPPASEAESMFPMLPMLPGVDLLSRCAWPSENNNPFDLVSRQLECQGDPFESVFMNSVTFQAQKTKTTQLPQLSSHAKESLLKSLDTLEKVPVLITESRLTGTVEDEMRKVSSDAHFQLGNKSFLDISNLSLFPDDLCPNGDNQKNENGHQNVHDQEFTMTSAPLENETNSISNTPSAVVKSKDGLCNVEYDLPDLNLDKNMSDLDIIMKVKSRVDKCIQNALNRSRSVLPSHLKRDIGFENGENLSPNVPIGSPGRAYPKKLLRSQSATTPREFKSSQPHSLIGSVDLSRPTSVVSTADFRLENIKESLKRIRSLNVSQQDSNTVLGTSSPQQNNSSLLNSGFVRCQTGSLGSSSSVENKAFSRKVSSTGTPNSVMDSGKLSLDSVFSACSQGQNASVINKGFVNSVPLGSTGKSSFDSNASVDVISKDSTVTQTCGAFRGRSSSLGTISRPWLGSKLDDSIFEEATALAHVFKERANSDSFVADCDASMEESAFYDLRTSKCQWKTSTLDLPRLQMEDAEAPPAMTPRVAVEKKLEGVAASPAQQEKSLLRKSFDQIMNMKPGDTGNRSLRRSLSTGFVQSESTSPVATSTPAPLSRDNIRDLSLQLRSVPATPAPLAPVQQAVLRTKRNVAQVAGKKGPMKAVLPLGNMMRKKGSPPKSYKSPTATTRKSKSPTIPVSTPVLARSHPEMTPQFTSTPRMKLLPPATLELSPVQNSSPIRPASSTVRSRSAVGYGPESPSRPSARLSSGVGNTPTTRRSSGHLKSLPSPILKPSNIIVNYAQTPEDMSVQAWNKGPAITVTRQSISSRTPLRDSHRPTSATTTRSSLNPQRSRSSDPANRSVTLVTQKGTFYNKPKENTRSPKASKGCPTNYSKNILSPTDTTPKNPAVLKQRNKSCLKPLTPNLLKDSNESISKLPAPVSKLPVSASPRQISRLQNMVMKKFPHNSSLPCEKENIRPRVS